MPTHLAREDENRVLAMRHKGFHDGLADTASPPCDCDNPHGVEALEWKYTTRKPDAWEGFLYTALNVQEQWPAEQEDNPQTPDALAIPGLAE